MMPWAFPAAVLGPPGGHRDNARSGRLIHQASGFTHSCFSSGMAKVGVTDRGVRSVRDPPFGVNGDLSTAVRPFLSS
jgi:hypothetical protein